MDTVPVRSGSTLFIEEFFKMYQQMTFVVFVTLRLNAMVGPSFHGHTCHLAGFVLYWLNISHVKAYQV